jgi:hypothetical protein
VLLAVASLTCANELATEVIKLRCCQAR